MHGARRSSEPAGRDDFQVPREDDQQTATSLGIRALILKPNTVDDLGRALHRLLGDPLGQDVKNLPGRS